MSGLLIAVILAGGAAAWVYYFIGRRAGAGNEKGVAIGAGVVFVMAFMFFFTLFRYYIHLN